MQLASHRWVTAGLAAIFALSLTACGFARSAPTVADDILRAGQVVIDDAGRAAAQAAQNRAARDELVTNLRAYLASDEWKATKAAAKIAVDVNRQDPACETTIDAVFDRPTDVATNFANLANDAQSRGGFDGLVLDAAAISDEASVASSDLDLARLAALVELFKDAYCQ